MEIIAIRYKGFKQKIKLTKEFGGYVVEDLGGILMLSRKITLN